MKSHTPLLRPDRLRTLERPFAWLPCRILNNGTIAAMSPHARQLYLVLALAADRRGISFHADSRIQATLGITNQQLELARADLIAMDLLAFDGKVYQLLALPSDVHHRSSKPPRPSTPHPKAASSKNADQAAKPSAQQHQRNAMPENVREILRGLFGPDSF